MANTTNIGLEKPAGTDYALVSVLNSNSDKIDAEAGRARANFAGTYSASSAYAVGDYCTKDGNLYRCTTAIGSGGEAWNSGHWTQVAIGTEVKGLSDQIGNIGTTDLPTSATVPTESGTWETVATKVLTPGTYIVIGDIFFDSSPNGIRILLLEESESTNNNCYNSVLCTGRADLCKTRILVETTNKTIYLRAYQSSGSSLYATGRISVIKIK